MRLREFEHGPTNTPESNLLTALELIRNRYRDLPTAPKISTQSLINLVLNTDRSFDYNALVQANKNNPAVKNLIKSFNHEYVLLQPFGDESEEVDITNTNDDSEAGTDISKEPVMSVDDMAKRAAKERGAPISALK